MAAREVSAHFPRFLGGCPKGVPKGGQGPANNGAVPSNSGVGPSTGGDRPRTLTNAVIVQRHVARIRHSTLRQFEQVMLENADAFMEKIAQQQCRRW